MDATIGRSSRSFFAIISSRQTASDAVADPPGLSIRSTMPRTDVSRRACADVLDQRIGADDGAVDRVVAALAAGDRARRVDDREPRTPVEPERRGAHARVVVAVDLPRFAFALQLVAHLIFVLHIVDEPGAQRLLGQERPLIDEPANFRLVLLPALGDPADDLLEQIAIERLVHLLVRGGIAGLR